MRGDRVEIVIDTGDGVRIYEIAATKAGRRVEVTTGRTVVEVTEVTRSGTPVRTARFMAGRVLALVEHPASEPAPDRDGNHTGDDAQVDDAQTAADASARLRALEDRPRPQPDW